MKRGQKKKERGQKSTEKEKTEEKEKDDDLFTGEKAAMRLQWEEEERNHDH